MRKTRLFLFIIQIVIAISAIPAGLSMIMAPSGGGLGLSTDILSRSPFTSFLLPGLLLFVVNGLGNALAAILTIRKNKNTGWVALSLGLFMIIWISVQVYMIGLTHILQPLFCVIGLIELRLGYLILGEK